MIVSNTTRSHATVHRIADRETPVYKHPLNTVSMTTSVSALTSKRDLTVFQRYRLATNVENFIESPLQSNPVNKDTEGAVNKKCPYERGVPINEVSVLTGCPY